MSIETEKWVRDGMHVWTEDCPDSGPRASCDTPETAQAVVMLPEALALLKRVLEKNAMDRLDDTEARDILRRAGVLGA